MGYDVEHARVDAIFQVSAGALDDATRVAAAAFTAALAAAGLQGRTSGVSIVEGDDPELLP